jgi:hypothetical protein
MFDTKILKRPAMTGVIRDYKDPESYPFTQAGILPETSTDGDQISWDIEVVSRDVDKFEGIHSPAGVRKVTKYSTNAAQLARTFKSKNIKGSILKNLREPGSDEKMEIAENMVAREIQKFRKLLNRQNEYMRAGALQGTLAMTIDGISHSIDYGIDSSHKPTASTLWSNPAANVVKDLNDWKTLIEEDSGYAAAWVFCSSEVMTDLVKNDDIMTYFGSTPAGGDYMKEGKIARLAGLNFVEHNATYKPEGGSPTRYLDKTKIVIVPAADMEWGDFVVGTDVVPSDDRSEIVEVAGMYSYSNVEINPASIQLFAGMVRLPIIRNPNAIVVATVRS